MARRNGRPGSYLMTDDYTGVTHYANELKRDYWGNYTKKPLQRNLQEIASPLLDPQPVPIFRANSYENVAPCTGESMPVYVGLTNVKTSQNSPGAQYYLQQESVGNAAVGCTLIVFPTQSLPGQEGVGEAIVGSTLIVY